MISLIVGLGNPGDEYQKTRHNAGFLFLDGWLKSQGGTFAYEAKFKGCLASCVVDGQSVRLLKPLTYMNKSGESLAACANYFDIPVENILVVHDELDLEPGDVRLKKAGGHGGHNGLRDIINHMSSKDFYRLRIGVGHPGDRNKVASYVLKSPGKVEAELIESAAWLAEAEMPAICQGDYQSVMKRLHTK